MGWLDELDESGFEHGETVVRQRRKTIADPYSGKQTLGDWTNPDEHTLEGAFVASSSTSSTREATRTQLLEEKSLYVTDPGADVLAGDRIKAGGVVYEIDGIPNADVNPFTGWQPVKEIPLRRAT